jgi:ribosomal protein L18
MKTTNGSKANVSEARLVAKLVAERAVVIETIQSLISQTVAESNNGVASVLWLSRIEKQLEEASKAFFNLSVMINTLTQ